MASSQSPRPLVAPHIAQLRPYAPGKPAEELKRELGLAQVVKLASNENAVGPPPAVIDAVRGLLDELWLYPDGATHDLVQAAARYCSVDPSQVVATNGSDEVIVLALQTFCRPGDTVLTAKHAFLQYKVFAAARGMHVVEAPCREPTRYDVDAMIEAARQHSPRLVCLANPSNPTGTYLSHDEVVRLLDGIGPEPIVLLDEAYAEYVDAPDYERGLEIVASRPRTVVMRTFSKAWGLAGMRVGFGISSPEVADYLNRMRTPFNVNRLAQRAAAVALSHPEHLDRVRAFNARSKAQLRAGLIAAGLGDGIVESQTNFFLVEVGVSGRALYEALLRRGVIVRPMDAYEFPTKIRVTAAAEADNARFIEALPEALAEVAAALADVAAAPESPP